MPRRASKLAPSAYPHPPTGAGLPPRRNKGIAQTRRIVRKFCWTKFKAPICAEADHKGKPVLVVLEGQHTATAVQAPGSVTFRDCPPVRSAERDAGLGLARSWPCGACRTGTGIAYIEGIATILALDNVVGEQAGWCSYCAALSLLYGLAPMASKAKDSRTPCPMLRGEQFCVSLLRWWLCRSGVYPPDLGLDHADHCRALRLVVGLPLHRWRA